MNDSAAVLSEHIQRGNIWRLAIAQALAGANAVVVYATGAIVGSALAPSPVLATLPISIFVVGMAACILPMGMIARRHGRRAAFLAGTGAGVLAGLLAMLAVTGGGFWLFCLATFFGGAYAAVVLSFRFAAADGVAPQRRARALSLVFMKVPGASGAANDYSIDHSAALVLLDPQARMAGVVQPPLNVKGITADLETLTKTTR